jgi:hypothetical protein
MAEKFVYLFSNPWKHGDRIFRGLGKFLSEHWKPHGAAGWRLDAGRAAM